MEDTPLNQPAVNESATPPLQTASRRMNTPQVRGLFVGFIPLGLLVVYVPVQFAYLALPAQFQLFDGSFLIPLVLVELGIYVSLWVPAVSMASSDDQNRHSFAKGMKTGLITTIIIVSCACVSLVCISLVSLANCHGCLH